MRSFILAIAIFFAVPCSRAAGTRNIADVLAEKSFVPGEVLVQISSQHSFAASRQSYTTRFGAQQAVALDQRGLTRVKLREGQSVAEGISELRGDSTVESVQPNFIYRMAALPNDTQIGNQWGIFNSAQTVAAGTYSTHNGSGAGAVAGSDMDLKTAWDSITDCSSVKVAVIDSGVNYTQEDLAANLWADNPSYPKFGFDFVDNDTDPFDGNGHGTHVAGTIGAVGNNGKGVAGVCWKAKIMALKVFDASGAGGTTANIVKAIDFAIGQGAKVINMSLSGTSLDAAQEAALARASAAGVVVVAAAGNDGTNNDVTPHYPCNSANANVICVAALDQAYALATFSNFGATSVDIGAPGTNIVSSWNGTSTTISNDFSTWTNSSAGAWAQVNCSLSGTLIPFFAIPNNYCDGSGNFTQAVVPANTSAAAFKNFTTINGFTSVLLGFYAFLDLGSSGTDAFGIAYRKANANPFLTGGVILDAYSGSSNGAAVNLSYDITACQGANCSVGFLVETDATAGASEFGVGTLAFSITGLTATTNAYNTINGTSMATPHVAGLAAMLFAFNPNYRMADVIASIKGGGVTAAALAGTTVTGKAASASGSLNFIQAPTGLTLAIKP